MQRIQNVYRKGKDIRKKRHVAAFVFVPSVFREKFPTGGWREALCVYLYNYYLSMLRGWTFGA
jgi:hypothetical protein